MKWYGLLLKEQCNHCKYACSEISIESNTMLIYGKEIRPCIKCRNPVAEGLIPICKRKYELHQELLYYEAKLFILKYENRENKKINSSKYVLYMRNLITAQRNANSAFYQYKKHPKLYSI